MKSAASARLSALLSLLVATSASAQAPPAENCRIKGNIISKGGRIYHPPGCRYYNATVIDTGAMKRATGVARPQRIT
jgi:hypothetical protein